MKDLLTVSLVLKVPIIIIFISHLCHIFKQNTNYSFIFLTDLILKILQSSFLKCKKGFFCTGVTMVRRSVLYFLFISTFFSVNVILQNYFWINCRFIFVFKINDISHEPMNVFFWLRWMKNCPSSNLLFLLLEIVFTYLSFMSKILHFACRHLLKMPFKSLLISFKYFKLLRLMTNTEFCQQAWGILEQVWTFDLIRPKFQYLTIFC